MNSRCSLSLETKDGALAKICNRLVTTQVLSPITGFVRIWGPFNIRTRDIRKRFTLVIGGGTCVGFGFLMEKRLSAFRYYFS
ncbi:hypothetical protein FIU96_12545 [Marinobacter sp. THAF39]|nr:hypothetical protein FIV08_12635 [Marinobacter sp. THAF197a]QFT51455.1 hypothetical protein FIU96_12545 [Marinobacter sp. THAF39]